MKLIDKDALVAETNRLDEFYHLSECDGGQVFIESFLSFINTLEAKEVDFEKYYHDFLQKEWFGNSHVRTVSEMMAFTAKHFFELGLAASNPLTVKDIENIYHLVNKVADDLGIKAMYVNTYQETLKRYKAQKGE